ncbi:MULTISPECIES: TetR/AcrR family transcriptional regulator [unclassified Mycolicibacterium]|uniref:TetR/AcrR family transcriptional regulator n=1 Tax=unclassified Mycolicibacterium TaxID=2636767 RepID=UPI0012DDA1CF|nr:MULTISPECIES: TetR/AcrR family transcriptional regulator [unclassified Mycolicibacterium]MUL82271.1 TetR/AcrR family transcriptional regulator [Mycolicibacterium sp. CBMA 329]MUL88037.1 TetR/AcrR family transcriptional regulator [Mycolicibacterium sp. CBMA 331]MUM02368.1 TetR/AcrR family transcriptional regulator [Mycolicibacterium sp. CBMA 334]MUM29123.1 TetR/AcrR family transcriptional regulator [Mycolicibacterium sp. CBMA 295]MUM38334.1 TetR/AcrR family transcriptional regulator [Mycolic
MAVRTVLSKLTSPSLLETATQVLLANPAASLGDIAHAAGMSRTTLHKTYPTRPTLLRALANDALELLNGAYSRAGLDVAGADAPAALARLATELIPLGPRLMFLYREHSLDDEPELLAQVNALDEPVRNLEQRARADGTFRTDLPDGWVRATFEALVYAAWEEIAAGLLAPLAAPDVVMSTLLNGVSAPPQKVR